jgi:hypothetical protein
VAGQQLVSEPRSDSMNDDRAGEQLRHELKLRIPGEVARIPR